MPMGAARHLSQARDVIVVRNAHLVGLGGAGRERDAAYTHDQQPGAALRARLVVGLDSLAAVAAFFGEVGAHGRHHDAVA